MCPDFIGTVVGQASFLLHISQAGFIILCKIHVWESWNGCNFMAISMRWCYDFSWSFSYLRDFSPDFCRQKCTIFCEHHLLSTVLSCKIYVCNCSGKYCCVSCPHGTEQPPRLIKLLEICRLQRGKEREGFSCILESERSLNWWVIWLNEKSHLCMYRFHFRRVIDN